MGMPIDPLPNERILVKIDEVDISTRSAHVSDKMNATLEASWRDTGGIATVIPANGELWTARREGYIWHLENRLDTEADQTFIANKNPGDSVIHTSGDLYLQGANVYINGVSPTDAAVILAPTSSTRNRIVPTGDFVPLKIKGGTGGTANLFEIERTGGASPSHYWDANGAYQFNGPLIGGTSGTLGLTGSAVGSSVLTTQDDGDSTSRFVVMADGTLNWGGGSGGTDIHLKRSAAGLLMLDDGGFYVTNASATGTTLATRLTTDSEARWVIQADGVMLLGPGNAVQDVKLYREQANVLRTDDMFRVVRGSGEFSFDTLISGDAHSRFAIGVSGKQEWGPGNVAKDTSLERIDAKQLLLTDTLSFPDRSTAPGSTSNQVKLWAYDNDNIVQSLFQVDDRGRNKNLTHPGLHRRANPQYVYLFTDFCAGASTHVNGDTLADGFIVALSGTGANIAAVNLDNHPGTVTMGTGTTATGFAEIRTSGNTYFSHPSLGIMRFAALVHVPTLSNGTNRYYAGAGFVNVSPTNFNTLAASSAGAMMFRYVDNVNSGKWQACTANNAGAETLQDTGVAAVVANQWYLLEVEAISGTVKFYVDGNLTNTITTNLPTANITPKVGIGKTVGTTELTMRVDYISVYAEVTR